MGSLDSAAVASSQFCQCQQHPAALRFASSFARHLPKPLSCQDKRSQVTAVGHQMTPDFHGKVMRHNARHVPLACSYGCIQVVHIQSCIFGIDRHQWFIVPEFFQCLPWYELGGWYCWLHFGASPIGAGPRQQRTWRSLVVALRSGVL